MRERLLAALKTSKADYTEIRLEITKRSEVVLHHKKIQTVDTTRSSGGVVRCLVYGGGWGIATFNKLDNLENRVEQAYQCAKSIITEKIELAPTEPVENITKVELEDDFRNYSLHDKRIMLEEYNNLILNYHNKIIDTRCTYIDYFSTIWYVNSEGTYIEEELPLVDLYLGAMAKEGDNVQSTGESFSSIKGYNVTRGRHTIAQIAAKRAVDLLSAETVKGDNYTVICDPALAGVFIHEAFGHLSESDFVYENPKAQEMMVLGRRFGKDFLNVGDNGNVFGLRGSHKYDDEGTPTGDTKLIENGILVGRLHNRETAAKMGEKPTGNARATSYRFAPIVRMTNTYIANGNVAFKDMIKDIKLGIYACNSRGGQTMLENFSFSSAYAYMIRDGEIAELVKDVILGGNLFETLNNIIAVGNDFRWIESGGRCGKGQSGLPVDFGAPHICIENVNIGGK